MTKATETTIILTDSEEVRMYILLTYDPSDVDTLKMLFDICKIAEVDPSNTIPHCFSTNYHDNTASIIYQFINNKLSIIIVESQGEYATMAWSKFNDIIVAPRRVYKTKGLRNTDIIMKFAMPWVEKKYNKVAKYIVSSFNNTKHGKLQYNIFKTKKFFKTHFKSNISFLDYYPLSDSPVNFFGTEQFLIYKKLGQQNDLTFSYIEETINSTSHQIQ